MTDRPRRIVIGITGASGAVYARRVMELLAAANVEMHLAVTPFGRRLLHDELGMEGIDADVLTNGRSDLVHLHRDKDVGAAIASGSFVHDGMLIVPASSNSLGAIANGVTLNLVHRAAAVTMKENRRLIIAHREMPMSPIDVENIATLSRAGAIIAPLSPGFYLLPTTIEELIDFVATRLVDLLGIEQTNAIRWTGEVPR